MLQITNKQDCCGCYACVQRCPKQCIRMESDEEGFEYPIIDKEQCINCGLCNKVCPQTNTSYSKQPINIYAIKHPDQEIQLQSSSGGAFSLIAEWVIQKGGVVFGAIFDDNWNVIHGYTESISGLEKLRMSKYVQSKIGLSFIHTENFLKKGKIVMFVGTPCQIHGLKLFLRKDYENLITVDFVCHGVPSPKIWKIYLNKTAKTNDIKQISFRNKKLGWENSSFVLQYKKQKSLSETLRKNPYLRGFIHDIYSRPCCYVCKNKSFKSGSDFTLADFWGIKNTYPNLYDKNGISCLTINTIHGMEIFPNMNIQGTQVNYNKALQYNPSFEHSVKMHHFRKLFFKLIHYIPFNQLVITIQIINKLYKLIIRK